MSTSEILLTNQGTFCWLTLSSYLFKFSRYDPLNSNYISGRLATQTAKTRPSDTFQKRLSSSSKQQVVLTQTSASGCTSSSSDSRKPSKVNVQVKGGDSGGDVSRRNTIDLQIGEGRSRKNTLVKVNGEVVSVSHSASNDDMSNSPRIPRNLSVRAKDGGGSNNNNQEASTEEGGGGGGQGRQIENSQSWPFFNPSTRFRLLKIIFVLMCLVDIMHWAYLLRDDTNENPNSWRFYKKFKSFDLYYLVARMFADIFTCVLGLGAAMWTRKPLLTLPCTMIQLLFLLIRAAVWSARSYNRVLEKMHATNEDKVFVICEFALPAIWALLSFLIVHTTRRLRCYEQLHGYARPPIIVLTVKNDDNDESVQIEIA